MGRKKSYRDITAQIDRIAARAGLDYSNPRVKKALNIGSKYIQNIVKTKSFISTANKVGKAEAESEEMYKHHNKLVNRKYSQRIYMGMSNG